MSHEIKEFEFYHDIINSLVAALEAKDEYTKGHSERVADMTYKLAIAYGLKKEELRDVHLAAHLHDIGKIGIPDSILESKAKLSLKQWELIKKHPVIGYNILNESNRLKTIAIIVLHHHERWDGEGYPYGLKGENIPLGSRMIAVCDAIDAMTFKRSYREPMTLEECRLELIKNKCTQFDPCLVELVQKVLFIKRGFYAL